MRPSVLLINPWIYDFAAYNLWAAPLGLYNTAEFLSLFDLEIKYIDCLEAYTPKRHNAGKYRSEITEKPPALAKIKRHYKRYGIGIEEFKGRLLETAPVDVALVASVMSYWYPGPQRVIELIKNCLGDIPVIVGGPYAALYPDHALSVSGADAVCIGNGHNSLKLLINSFGFKLKQICKRPLPYFSMGFNKHTYAPIQTSTGCPFRCVYCASHLLQGDYKARDIDTVVRELESLSKNGIVDVAFYDDALLYNPDSHIKPILREIIKRKLPLRFHTPNGIHARYIDEETAYLMKRSNFKTLRIGLETIDTTRQIETGGKTTSDEFIRAISQLRTAGFNGSEIGVYLMYGLPRQEIKEVLEGVKYLKQLGVTINLTEFSPIKGTIAWTELEEMGILPDNTDPLLTNNTIFNELFGCIDTDDLRRLRLDVKAYNSLLSTG